MYAVCMQWNAAAWAKYFVVNIQRIDRMAMTDTLLISAVDLTQAQFQYWNESYIKNNSAATINFFWTVQQLQSWFN